MLVGGWNGVEKNITGDEDVKELRGQRNWWVVHTDAKSNKIMARCGGREDSSETDVQVFHEWEGMSRMRSADNSNEAEQQRGNFYKRANNNGLAVVEGGYEDVSPIHHCSWSMQAMRKWAASIWEEWKGMHGFREDQWRCWRVRVGKVDKKWSQVMHI